MRVPQVAEVDIAKSDRQTWQKLRDAVLDARVSAHTKVMQQDRGSGLRGRVPVASYLGMGHGQ